ncbi:tRNA dihydrouridine synthase DusB [Thiorhodovibrio frisius]|uniref:tRNA-dihydrouridine synthase B n=1 Tax=Thiorhodovibrio frisius TaxID=631362 RepID=H8YYG8_9GAMM|nr:tRNA dihydrouridine synthase DusB [Thiorhodovibrio frisius]EIC23494.1 putative TIM-barrel protein, nifR3 family [Thiorhodovibrio frisius]WPL23419.1 putative tRNA-dihydrouridine synthase [Thiorhodovibrio frisius]
MPESVPMSSVANRLKLPLRIGSLELPSRVFLAPMASITDRPFRRLCREFGAGLAFSEMLSANPALRHTRTSAERLDHQGEPRPFAVQIAGANPEDMADFARHAVDQGADLIDINLGCPAKKVCRQAAGSALLRDEPLVARIMEQVVRAVNVPVSVKTRTGWSPQEKNLAQIAQIAQNSGIAMLTVHGRTRACGYNGQAEHNSLSALREQITIPLVANGDIDTAETAHKVLEQTGADAVMIGRAALGKPWIFARIERFLATGEQTGPPDPAVNPERNPDQIRDILLSHLAALHDFYGEARGLRVARKHIIWYCQDLPGFKQASGALLMATSAAIQHRLVQSYFANLMTGETDT